MANPEWDNYAPKPQRYKICGDDSGHRYFIPVEQEQNFYLWVESFTADLSTYDGPSFDKNRIDGRFTFTDPRCD